MRQAKRVALVIANSRYVNASTLPNPSSDAKLIGAALKRAGFDSVDIRIDLGKTALESELRAFGQKAEGDFFPWEKIDLVDDLKAALA